MSVAVQQIQQRSDTKLIINNTDTKENNTQILDHR